MDYFWQFSFVIPIKYKAERAFWKEIIDTPWKSETYKSAAESAGMEEIEEGDKTLNLGIEWDGFKDDEEREEHPEKARQVWIHDDGQSQTGMAWEIVQSFLKLHRPHDYMFVDWSITASRPVTDANGGGTVFISADTIAGNPVDEWEKMMEKKHKAKHPKAKKIRNTE